MTYDRARPLHVFDAKKVQGNLTVRRARASETLLALDGRTYTLDSNVCVIADDHGVESLAGIMGGEASGCDENTTDVLIESALWNEINIAQTGRKLGINSDARYRFERGVDPAFMVPGLELATKLVLEMCGGTPSENVVVGNPFGADRVIEFPLNEVKRLAAIDVPLVEMKRILGHLGFMVAGSGPLVKIAVPSWRTDVEGKADIVEEIVRIVGVDKVPMTPFDRGDAPRKPVSDPDPASYPPRQARARRPRHGGGRDVVVHLETGSGAIRRRTGRASRSPTPSPPTFPILRPSLLPGLVAAVQATSTAASRMSGCSSRPGLQGRQAGGSAGCRIGRAPRLCIVKGPGTALVRLGHGGRARRQGRCIRGARRRRRADAGAADRAGRRELAASRPFRYHPDRPAKCAGPFRRTASARAGGAWRRRSADSRSK